MMLLVIGLTGEFLADAALTLLWAVGVTNALGVLDDTDGQATTIAAAFVGATADTPRNSWNRRRR